MPGTEILGVVRRLVGHDSELAVVRELGRFSESRGFEASRFYDVIHCPFRGRAFFVLRWSSAPLAKASEGYRVEDTFGLVQRLVDGPAVWAEQQLPELLDQPWVEDLELKGKACVDLPIRDDNELIGVFSVSRDRQIPVLPEELFALSTIALLAGARLSSIRRRLNARLLAEMLSSVDSHVRSEVLAGALGRLGEAVDAERVSFFVRDPARQRLKLLSEVCRDDTGAYVQVPKSQRSGSPFLRELAQRCWDDERMRFIPIVDGLPASSTEALLGRDGFIEEDASLTSVMHVKVEPFDSDGGLVRVVNRASNRRLLFTAGNRESLHQLAIPFRQLMMTMESVARFESLWTVLSESLTEIQTEGLNFRAIASFLRSEGIAECGVASFGPSGAISEACRVRDNAEVTTLRLTTVADGSDLRQPRSFERAEMPPVVAAMVDAKVDLAYVVPFNPGAVGRSEPETTICVFALHLEGTTGARHLRFWKRQHARLHMLDIVGRLIGAMRELTRNRRLLYLADEAVGTIGHEIRSPAAALHGCATEILAVAQEAVRSLARGGEVVAAARPWDASESAARPIRSVPELLAWMDRGGQFLSSYRDRLRRVVDDAIRWARLGGKSLEVSFERVDLGRLLDEALLEMRSELQAKPFLRVEVDATVQRLEPIVADSFLIKILLSNLLDNAVKYSHSRNPRWRLSDKEAIRYTSTIAVRAERQAQLVDLFFTNWGLGIDPADYQNIFSSFYRSAVRDRLHTVRGVGLGLPTCRKIVLVHRGTILVRSRPTLQDPDRIRQKEGYETTFVVRLPLDLKPGRFDIDMSVINAG